MTCISVCGRCAHECRYHQKPKEGVESPGARDKGSCELRTYGLGTSQVLEKNRTCSELPSHLSSPKFLYLKTSNSDNTTN